MMSTAGGSLRKAIGAMMCITERARGQHCFENPVLRRCRNGMLWDACLSAICLLQQTAAGDQMHSNAAFLVNIRESQHNCPLWEWYAQHVKHQL